MIGIHETLSALNALGIWGDGCYLESVILKKYIFAMCLMAGFLSPALMGDDLSELKDLCLKIEKEVSMGKTDLLNSTFSRDLFMDRVKAFNPSSEILANCQKNLDHFPDEWTQYFERIDIDSTDFALLRVEKDGKDFKAIYRNWGKSQFEYLTLHFVKTPNGFAYSDFFSYSLGVHFSESLFVKSLMLPETKGIEKVWSEYLGVSFENKDLAALEPFIDATLEDSQVDVHRAYSKLPSKLKKNKLMLSLYVNAAQGKGYEQYFKAVQTFKKYRPEDLKVNLLLFDICLYQERFDEALEALDILEKSVGGDPYLTFQRGHVYLKAGKIKASVAEQRKALAKDPTLLEPWFDLIPAYRDLKDYAELVRVLDKLAKDYNMPLPPHILEDDPEFGAFVKSSAFAEWKARQ